MVPLYAARIEDLGRTIRERRLYCVLPHGTPRASILVTARLDACARDRFGRSLAVSEEDLVNIVLPRLIDNDLRAQLGARLSDMQTGGLPIATIIHDHVKRSHP